MDSLPDNYTKLLNERVLNIIITYISFIDVVSLQETFPNLNWNFVETVKDIRQRWKWIIANMSHARYEYDPISRQTIWAELGLVSCLHLPKITALHMKPSRGV